jgi:hypothetical protein
MMRKPLLAAILCALLLAVAPAEAQTYHDNPTIVPGVVPIPANIGGVANAVSVSTSSSATNLPASASLYPAININNAGSVTAYVQLGASTTTSAGAAIPAGGNACLSAGNATQLAAITASSTTTLNITQANACIQGAGGGGSGGGGGGGAITGPLGSSTTDSASVATTDGGTPPSGVTLTSLGCTGATGLQGALLCLIQSAQASIAAGTAIIGKFGIDQTTPGTTNGVAPSTPVGAANFTPAQVSVLTTATLIAAARTGAPGTGRASITIINKTGTDFVCLGGSGVTASTGLCLPEVAGASITLNTTSAIYGIVATTSQTVTEGETY